jgi:transcriptional regulator with XRE-family HTH domain
MNKAQRERFQRAGWKVGTVGEFFDLTPAEEALIETKLRLGGLVRALRERSHLSQADLAKRIGSSQPRVAKIENHDPEVSLDLQMKAIFASRPSASRELATLIKKWEAPISTGSLAHARRSLKTRSPLLGRNSKATKPKGLTADRLNYKVPSSGAA